MDEQITSSILTEISTARELGKEPAFLFDRISSMRQQDGISLDYQGEGGRAYAERNNLHVAYAFMVPQLDGYATYVQEAAHKIARWAA